MLQTRASSTGFEPKIPVPISVPEIPVPISVPEPGNMQALWNSVVDTLNFFIELLGLNGKVCFADD